ncbi:nitroreductase/quinone reductase family protein [Streptosporangium canum]|uniref:nitroreductase/quinone reductase family protein n=1 Tax=Streptosporangium canum TaxID=324952 RepID=UPI00367D0743
MPEQGAGTWLLIGSNFGRPGHPAWTANLLAHPDADINWKGEDIPVPARLLDSAEREEAWASVSSGVGCAPTGTRAPEGVFPPGAPSSPRTLPWATAAAAVATEAPPASAAACITGSALRMPQRPIRAAATGGSTPAARCRVGAVAASPSTRVAIVCPSMEANRCWNGRR